MPKTRSAAPEQFKAQAYVSERLKLEQEYDAKYPDYKHLWKSINADPVQIKKLCAEPVLDKDGEHITNGMQMLFRVPIARWNEIQRAAASQSLARVRSVYQNDDGTSITDKPLTVLRNPKRPIGME